MTLERVYCGKVVGMNRTDFELTIEPCFSLL